MKYNQISPTLEEITNSKPVFFRPAYRYFHEKGDVEWVKEIAFITNLIQRRIK